MKSIPLVTSSYFAVFVTGIAIGWLLGLSASPVLSIAVTSIMTLVSGLIAASMGLPEPVAHEKSQTENAKEDSWSKVPSVRRFRVDPLPLMILMLGLCLGATIGVVARTHDLFGFDPDREAKKWKKTNLPEQEIYRTLFAENFKADSAPATRLGVLFADEAKSVDVHCRDVQETDPSELRRKLALLSDQRVVHFAVNAPEPALKPFIKDFLCFDSSQLHH